MIGYFKISAIGTVHLEKPDGVCQDYSDVLTLENGYTIAVIADGLGSASKSDVGAKIAVNTVLKHIKKCILPQKADKFYLHLLYEAYQSAYKNVINYAKKMKIDFSEYNTTLTAAIYDGKTLYYGQCGDGGIIVLTPNGNYDCATEVKKGEAFNETFPLLGGPDNWYFGKYSGEVCALTLMTDGIFDIVCHPLLANEEQKINIPFIRRFMDRNILRANNETDFEDLQKGVSKFISGNGLPNVTDDKTIVGLINTDVLADLKDDEYYKEPDWDKLNENMKRKLREGNTNPIFLQTHPSIEKKAIDKVKVNNDAIKELNKRLHNSYRINRQLKKIILIQMIMILALIIICSICIVFLIKDNDQDTPKKNMVSSNISKDTVYNSEHMQESVVVNNDTISDHADDFTQSYDIESHSENTDITDTLKRILQQDVQETGKLSTGFTDVNSNTVDVYNSNIMGAFRSDF